MQERINELRAVYAGYSGIVKKLYKEAAKQGNRKAMEELRKVWDRLQQGPIRAMVVGVSSAGKSTVLNALAEKIVAPEGSHTTSPVPVWIYSDGTNKYNSPRVCIFKTGGENTLPSAEDNNIGVSHFVSTYCYTPEEAGEGCTRDPEKYKNVKAASVNVGGQNNHIYTSGITFMDTPGIGVSVGDNARVEDVISGGCEIALVVFKSLNESEPKEFLRKQFVDKNTPQGRVLKNDRVFAVHNYIASSTHTTEGEETNLKAVFGDRLRHKLFEINSRYVRNEKAGTYDYLGLLPGGTTDEVLEDAEKQQNSEKTDIAAIDNNNSLKKLLEKSRKEFDNLWEDLERGVKELLDKQEELFIPVCGSINGRFRELKVEDGKLEKELNKLNERSIELIKKAHSKVSEARKADYEASVKVVQSILGSAPDSLINKHMNAVGERLIKESYEAFIKLRTFGGYWPIADDEDSARNMVYDKIVTEAGCKAKGMMEVNTHTEQRLRVQRIHSTLEYIRRFVVRLQQLVAQSVHDTEVKIALGCPAAWKQEDREEYARIVSSAGFKNLYVVSESRAAFLYARHCNELQLSPESLRQPTLVIDIGSSTTDYAYIVDGKERDMGVFGEECLGGGILDELILEYAIEKYPQRETIEKVFAEPPLMEKLLRDTRPGAEGGILYP